MKKLSRVTVLVSAILITLAGCATAEVAQLSAKGKSVKVAKEEPGKNCEEIGPIEANHGGGCTAFTQEEGTIEGAYNELKNAAGKKGANYVRMDSQVPPNIRTGTCEFKAFTIRGVAFNCK